MDLHGPSREDLPRSPDYFSGESFHLSDVGYMRMAEHFWPVLLQAADCGTSSAQATG